MTITSTGRKPGRLAPFPFTRWRLAGFALSLALLLASLGALGLRGLDLGIDFTGGVSVEASLGREADAGALADLRARLAAEGLSGAEAQGLDGGSVLIRLPPAEGGGAAAAEAVSRALGAGAEMRAVDVVGPKVSGELLRSGALASILAVLGIAAYVWLRFEARFAFAALLTTAHDVAMVVGLFAVTRISFDLTSVAALLAVAGYSINDTVVVFDRIRETLGRPGAGPLPLVIDQAVTEMLRRTLMTSGTTLAATVSLMIFGGPALFGFAAATSFGIALGTISSICIAAPLLLHLPGALTRRAGEGKEAGEPGP